MKESKERDNKMTGKSVVDVVLLIISWLTISPLMLVINRHEKYLKRWVMWVLIVISPLTFNIVLLCDALLLMVPVYGGLVHGVNLSGFPELTQFSDNGIVLLIEFIALPVYAVCVMILFGVMLLTGWSYKEASVYVCEYFQPLICAFVALSIIILILCKLTRMNIYGRLLSLIPLFAEIYFIWQNVQVYFERKALYTGMSNDAIFKYVVDYLIEMAKRSHTNYILANMYVYILPMLMILAVGFAGKLIYNKTRTNIQQQQICLENN